MAGTACCAPRVMHAFPGLPSTALDVQAPVPEQQGKTAPVSVAQLFRGDEGDPPDDTQLVPGPVPYVDARPEHLRGMSAAAERVFLQPDAGPRNFLPQQHGQFLKHGRIGFYGEHGDS